MGGRTKNCFAAREVKKWQKMKNGAWCRTRMSQLIASTLRYDPTPFYYGDVQHCGSFVKPCLHRTNWSHLMSSHFISSHLNWIKLHGVCCPVQSSSVQYRWDETLIRWDERCEQVLVCGISSSYHAGQLAYCIANHRETAAYKRTRQCPWELQKKS